MEYVVEAKDADDCRDWLASIRSCMGALPFPDNEDGTIASVGNGRSARRALIAHHSTSLTSNRASIRFSRSRIPSAPPGESSTLIMRAPGASTISRRGPNRLSAVFPASSPSSHQLVTPTRGGVMTQSTSSLGRSLSTGRQPRTMPMTGLAVSSRSLHGIGIHSVNNSASLVDSVRLLRLSNSHVGANSNDSGTRVMLFDRPLVKMRRI